jgi:hypothetical protein
MRSAFAPSGLRRDSLRLSVARVPAHNLKGAIARRRKELPMAIAQCVRPVSTCVCTPRRSSDGGRTRRWAVG